MTLLLSFEIELARSRTDSKAPIELGACVSALGSVSSSCHCCHDQSFLALITAGVIHAFPCRCDSTNHSFLSSPREISVNRSAVSASPSSTARSIELRIDLPTTAIEVESRFNVIPSGHDLHRIGPQCGATPHHIDGPLGLATECRDSLGDAVCEGGCICGDGIEQLVQSDEVRPLHVPMCLLRLKLQVDQFSEPLD